MVLVYAVPVELMVCTNKTNNVCMLLFLFKGTFVCLCILALFSVLSVAFVIVDHLRFYGVMHSLDHSSHSSNVTLLNKTGSYE